MQKSIHGLPVPAALAEEIERALELMEMVRRVRTAELAQGKGKVVELPRTRYGTPIPKPLVYPVSHSSGERGASAP